MSMIATDSRYLSTRVRSRELVGEGMDFRQRHTTMASQVTSYLDAQRILAECVQAVRNGAQSAREGDTDGLTYADGWAAAATILVLTAADARRSLQAK